MKIKTVFKILVFVVLVFTSCNSSVNEKNIKVTKDVLKSILIEEDFKNRNYSTKNYFHAYFERFDEFHSRVRVTFHHLKPEQDEKHKKFILEEVECYFYNEYPSVFFVPDNKCFDFLIEEIGDDILLNKIEPYFLQSKDSIYINEEIDF